MTQSTIGPDLIFTVLFGILQVLVGLLSLWEQRRLCQITGTQVLPL